MQIKIDINVCRVCLKADARSAPLFADAPDGTDYAAKFTYATQLKVIVQNLMYLKSVCAILYRIAVA